MKLLRKGLAGTAAVALASALAFFATAAIAGPIDTDGDGIPDNADNCILTPNAAQVDTDGDGCGNYCDSDYDQNGVVGASDVGKFSGVTCFNTPGGTVPPGDPVCDCDSNGSIGAIDVGCFTTNFNRPQAQFTGGVCVSAGCPGPSAFPGPACRQ